MSGRMINIGGDKSDSSYRYKMPVIVTKVEGRGNGIKTVIVNMVDVSKALHIDPAYTTRFFGYELGAQSTYKEATERSIVNGKHEAADLQKVLEKFIDNFILCPNCGLPEIKLHVRKDIKADCAACGFNGPLPTSHKLSGYIIKDCKEKRNKKKKEGKDKGKDKDKKKKDKKKDKDKKKNKDKEDEGDEDAEAAKAAKKEKKEKKKRQKEEEEVVWHTDISEAAMEARRDAEFADMKLKGEKKKTVEDIMNAAGEGSKDLPSTVLKIFLADGERTITDIVEECRRLQLARGLDEPQKIKVLLEAVIDTEPKMVAKSYAKHSELIAKFIKSTKQAQILIGCIEEQVGIIKPDLMPRVPLIFQALYEGDVLTEDVLLTWHASPPESSWLSNNEVATKVRARATPFIEWLKTAESDSEESDE